MKKLSVLFLLITSLSFNIAAQETTEQPILNNFSDSLSYCFGLLIGNNLSVQKVDKIDLNHFVSGFNFGYNNLEPIIAIEDANKIVQDYFQKQVDDEANMNLEKSKSFLDENCKQEGVVTLPSGLQYKILTPGSGDHPLATDKVKVNYRGTFIDGTVFDSSIDRNEPVVFGVDQVIPGWTEALQLMQPGAKWMLYVPPDLAYGDKGAGGVIGPNQALIFEVDLIEIVK